MSELLFHEPRCDQAKTPRVELVITARLRDLGGFSVRRVLPSPKCRTVGPFAFFDHMGPTVFGAGGGIDVRPHPHIGLATVTYLFDGEVLHRDNLGSTQAIRPGDVNWMIAGRGIAHSERTAADRRRSGGALHGIQSWVALPLAEQERAPSFDHHPAPTIPRVELPGAALRVVAGKAYGTTSPVTVLSPTFYVAAELDEGASLPVPDEYMERAAYVVEGTVACDESPYDAGTMLVFSVGASVELVARTRSRVMLLGGAKLDGPRHVWWNFVSTSEERIEQARRDWKEGRFAKIPGDEQEFIPLPDR